MENEYQLYICQWCLAIIWIEYNQPTILIISEFFITYLLLHNFQQTLSYVLHIFRKSKAQTARNKKVSIRKCVWENQELVMISESVLCKEGTQSCDVL